MKSDNRQLSSIVARTVVADGQTLWKLILLDSLTGLISAVQPLGGAADAPADAFVCRADELLLPGMIDLHIHAREDETGQHNHKETYRTALDAALNGGVVHTAAMPNTPSPLITSERLDWHRQAVAQLRHPVGLVNYVGIGPGTRPLPGKHLYKVYTGPSVGPLFFRSAEELEETLQHYEGQNVSFHVEDFEVLQRCANAPDHSRRRPEECVSRALEYLLPMIEKFRIQAKLCHWPTGGDTLEEIAWHKERMDKLNLGINTTLEVSPMHLYFDSDMTDARPELWPYLQMNPALRSRESRLKLANALKDGTIDFLATDHAPHTLEEKFKNFAQFKIDNGETNQDAYRRLLSENLELCRKTCQCDGVSGAPWLDTYAATAMQLVDEYGFTIKDIIRVTAERPAQFINPYLGEGYGLGYGRLAPGFRASFSIVDEKAETLVERNQLKTNCGWSPLEGKSLRGRLTCVVAGGRLFWSAWADASRIA